MFKKLLILFLLISVIGCKKNSNTTAAMVLVNPNQDSTVLSVPKELENYYKEIDFSLRSIELYEALATTTIAKHTNILTYRERHNFLYDIDSSPTNNKNVVLIYSGEERYWKEYVSGKNPYKKQTFNTEHVYPQSLIENTAKGDLHHLRVCDQTVNTRRSNNKFIDGSGSYKLEYKSWFEPKTSRPKCPTPLSTIHWHIWYFFWRLRHE